MTSGFVQNGKFLLETAVYDFRSTPYSDDAPEEPFTADPQRKRVDANAENTALSPKLAERIPTHLPP